MRALRVLRASERGTSCRAISTTARVAAPHMVTTPPLIGKKKPRVSESWSDVLIDLRRDLSSPSHTRYTGVERTLPRYTTFTLRMEIWTFTRLCDLITVAAASRSTSTLFFSSTTTLGVIRCTLHLLFTTMIFFADAPSAATLIAHTLPLWSSTVTHVHVPLHTTTVCGRIFLLDYCRTVRPGALYRHSLALTAAIHALRETPSRTRT